MILDAKTMTLLAEVTAPQLTPLGLHNKYVIISFFLTIMKHQTHDPGIRYFNHIYIENFIQVESHRPKWKLRYVFAGFTTQKVD